MSARLAWTRSLHARLVALHVGLLLALGAVLLVGLVYASRLFFDEVHSRLNGGVAAHVAETIRPGPDGTFAEADLKALFMDVMVVNPSLEVYLVDLEGRLLAYDAPEERILRRRVDLAPVGRFLAAGPERIVRGDDPRSASGVKPISAHPVEVDGRPVAYVYVILGGQGSDSVLAALRQSWVARGAAAALAGGILISAILGVFALGRLTRPLRRLRGEMARLSVGEADGAGEPGDGGDELAALERAFERMARRIRTQVRELEENDERRREFVASISHDLRTPASAVRGYLETLLLRAERSSPEERRQHLEIALRQAERLGRLVEQLFELARLEARESAPHREAFSLSELVQDIVCEQEVAAAGKGVGLFARFPYDLSPVCGDIGLIERALDNLIDNAVRYTPRGGTVVVSLAQVEGGVEVRVRDDGPGIPSDELPRLFDRFYRVRAAYRDAGEGTGLGLAITRRIVHLHGSEIAVESRPAEGTTFRFVLGHDEREGPGPAAAIAAAGAERAEE